MRLRGRNVVVAGEGPGLGSAVARRALEEGAQVYAVARRREHLEPLAALGIRTGAFGLFRPGGPRPPRRRPRGDLGRVDGLAITAGSWAPGRLEETEEEVLDSMFSVNLRAHLWAV